METVLPRTHKRGAKKQDRLKAGTHRGVRKCTYACGCRRRLTYGTSAKRFLCKRLPNSQSKARQRKHCVGEELHGSKQGVGKGKGKGIGGGWNVRGVSGGWVVGNVFS
jgi:hypothetical protein